MNDYTCNLDTYGNIRTVYDSSGQQLIREEYVYIEHPCQNARMASVIRRNNFVTLGSVE